MAKAPFDGEEYEVKTGKFPPFLMFEFSAAIEDGADEDPSAAAAAMFRILRECVAPGDWSRFRNHARGIDDPEKLMAAAAPLITARMEQVDVADRPTSPPSVSSDGHGVIEAKPESNFDDKVWEAAHGRPDIYNGLMKAREMQQV